MNYHPSFITTVNEYANRLGQFVTENKTRAEKIFNKYQEKIDKTLALYGGNQIDYMRFTITPFCINKKTLQEIIWCSHMLHQLLEKVFDAVHNDDKKLINHFTKHSHLFKYLIKTKKYWQGYGRYDFLVTKDGILKFIETNTTGGAGFFYLNKYHAFCLNALEEAEISMPLSDYKHEYQDPLFFVNKMLVMEKEANIFPHTILITHDDNNLITANSLQAVELKMMQEAFEKLERNVVFSHVAAMSVRDNNLYYKDNRISLAFNKIWVAAKENRWCGNMLNKYQNYLQAIHARSFLPINGLCSLTIGEDKSIFAVFTDDQFSYLFSSEERSFINRYIPWTRKLINGNCFYKGNEVNLFSLIINNKNRFVLKPENGRRGEDVFIGNKIEQNQWSSLVANLSNADFIVQEYIEPIAIKTVFQQKNKITSNLLLHTGSVYVINGEMAGILSRVSTEEVMNVRKNGFLQPVIVVR